MIRIALYGSLGYSMALRLLRLHEEALANRFSRRFLSVFKKDRTERSVSAVQMREEGCLFWMLPIEEGGLAGALWKACEEVCAGKACGCEVDLYRVPVMQEVVEICELYDENPYEAPSEGCFLVLWDEENEDRIPEDFLSIIRKSVIIGKFTTNRRRVLIAGGHERYLTPWVRQEKDILDRTGKAGGQKEKG